ncbi:hypothetical protein V6O07_14870, partial [Arthrospira platensis SPKY2]
METGLNEHARSRKKPLAFQSFTQQNTNGVLLVFLSPAPSACLPATHQTRKPAVRIRLNTICTSWIPMTNPQASTG